MATRATIGGAKIAVITVIRLAALHIARVVPVEFPSLTLPVMLRYADTVPGLALLSAGAFSARLAPTPADLQHIARLALCPGAAARASSGAIGRTVALVLPHTAQTIPANDLTLPILAGLARRAFRPVVRLPTTIIINAIAHFGSQMRNFGIQRLAVRSIEVPVFVVVQVTKIAHTISVKVLLFRIVKSGTVVLLVFETITVFVKDAVSGTAILRLVEIGLALRVPAPLPAVRRTQNSRFGEPACPVSARAAVHRADLGGFISVTRSVSAGSITILRATLFGFAPAADTIAANCTIQ